MVTEIPFFSTDRTNLIKYSIIIFIIQFFNRNIESNSTAAFLGKELQLTADLAWLPFFLKIFFYKI